MRADATTISITLLLYVAFDRVAAELGSTSGEAGVVVGAIVVALTLAAQCGLARERPSIGLAGLGWRAPAPRAAAWAVVLCFVLLAWLPLYAWATQTPLALRSGAVWLALGLFAQAGIAEETLFRGFLYRRLRERRAFWPAAGLSALPFVAVHLPVFATLDFAVALAALLLALSLSFPLARWFDIAGSSMWPGALLHAVIQGAIKLVEPAGDAWLLAIAWMVPAGLLPWLVFLLPVRHGPTAVRCTA